MRFVKNFNYIFNLFFFMFFIVYFRVKEGLKFLRGVIKKQIQSYEKRNDAFNVNKTETGVEKNQVISLSTGINLINTL